jgi:hypothetical protein
VESNVIPWRPDPESVVSTEAGWTSRTLTDPQDVLDLPAFGLTCRIADLYKGTPLRRRATRG